MLNNNQTLLVDTKQENISEWIIPIDIVNLSENQLPEYSTSGSSGMDLKASFTNDNLKEEYLQFAAWDEESEHLIIFSGGRALVPTDLFVDIPFGYEIQVRPRSGLALKHGVTVLNTPGTIDSDYRGNIGVILINLGDDPFIVEEGDRICQVVLSKVEKISWNKVDKLNTTKRGGAGFGSTGKN